MIFRNKRKPEGSGEGYIHWGDSDKMHVKIGHNKHEKKFYIQISDRSPENIERDEVPSYRIYLTEPEMFNVLQGALSVLRFESKWTTKELVKLCLGTEKVGISSYDSTK